MCAAALTSTEVREMTALLMERMDGKGGNSDGRVQFEEFVPWYQSVLDKHRAFVARSKPAVERPKRVKLSRAAPAAPAGDEDWLSTFTKQFRDVGAAMLPAAGGGAPVPSYHAGVPKPGSKRYEALCEEAKGKFEHYDKGKKGWLDEKDTIALAVDLHATFRPKSAHLSDKEAEAAASKLLKRLDTNADGGIELEEFIPWYLRMLDHVHRWIDAHDGVDAKDKKLVAERFAHYDKDESGYLDEFELGLLAADLHRAFHPEAAPLSQEERKRMAAVLMHRMDERHGNSDGRVEFEEFMPWYLTVMKDHVRFMELKKKEEPPIVVKMDKVKVQRAARPVLRSAPPPAPSLSLPSLAVLSSSAPAGVGSSSGTGKHVHAHHNKLVPFYQGVNTRLHARVVMFSWHGSSPVFLLSFSLASLCSDVDPSQAQLSKNHCYT